MLFVRFLPVFPIFTCSFFLFPFSILLFSPFFFLSHRHFTSGKQVLPSAILVRKSANYSPLHTHFWSQAGRRQCRSCRRRPARRTQPRTPCPPERPLSSSRCTTTASRCTSPVTPTSRLLSSPASPSPTRPLLSSPRKSQRPGARWTPRYDRSASFSH